MPPHPNSAQIHSAPDRCSRTSTASPEVRFLRTMSHLGTRSDDFTFARAMPSDLSMIAETIERCSVNSRRRAASFVHYPLRRLDTSRRCWRIRTNIMCLSSNMIKRRSDSPSCIALDRRLVPWPSSSKMHINTGGPDQRLCGCSFAILGGSAFGPLQPTCSSRTCQHFVLCDELHRPQWSLKTASSISRSTSTLRKELHRALVVSVLRRPAKPFSGFVEFTASST